MICTFSMVVLENVAGLCRVLTVLRRQGVKVERMRFEPAAAGGGAGLLTLDVSAAQSPPEYIAHKLGALVGVLDVTCSGGSAGEEAAHT